MFYAGLAVGAVVVASAWVAWYRYHVKALAEADKLKASAEQEVKKLESLV